MDTNKVLIADDQRDICNILGRQLRIRGFEVYEAFDGKSALDIFKAADPLFVISDIRMPEMDGITLLQEIKSISKECIVILMTGFGDEEVIIQALRHGASNFFQKPLSGEMIVQFIENMQVRTTQEQLDFYLPCVEKEERVFRLSSNNVPFHRIINQISENLGSVFPQDQVINIRVGIEEILKNAYEHGTLGITNAQKKEAIEEGRLGELYTERLAREGIRKKTILIESKLYPSGFYLQVTDQGHGFDWRPYIDCSEQSIISYSGHGLLLVRMFFDNVEFNETGNSIRVYRRVSDY
ncbi:MAG: response regulator [Spirochaetia bacterium]